MNPAPAYAPSATGHPGYPPAHAHAAPANHPGHPGYSPSHAAPHAQPHPGYPIGPAQPYAAPAPTMAPPVSSAPPMPSGSPWVGASLLGPHSGRGEALGRVAAALPAPSGLPAVVALLLPLVAVAVALVFDVVFLNVHVPGVGGYIWYLTTALSFAGAGFAAIKWTRASSTTATVGMGIAGLLYGAGDLGLEMVVEHLTVNDAIYLAAQGIAIAFVCGFGGIRKGERAKED